MPHFPRLVLACFLLTTNAAVSAAPPQVLSVTARCHDNEKCIFDNIGMVFDLTVTNNSSAPIGVPLEFLEQTGHVVRWSTTKHRR